jgi:hypothetical protein
MNPSFIFSLIVQLQSMSEAWWVWPLGRQIDPVISPIFWWFPQFVAASRNTQIAGLASCWAIWKLRNKACFEKKMIKNLIEQIRFSAVL